MKKAGMKKAAAKKAGATKAAISPRAKFAARSIVAAGVVLAVVAAIPVVILYAKVRDAAVRDDSRPAQAIVVFGAAEYAGRPSRTLRARLDHALTLYHRGLAPLIVTTGGPGGDPSYTEAGVARDYLVARGVPPEEILVENTSTTTDQTVVLVAEMLERRRISTCVVVSDGYHLFRIQRQLASRGITAYTSPRPSQEEPSHWTFLKQVFAYLLWRAGILL